MAPRRGARGGWLGRPPKNGRGARGGGRSAAAEPELPDLSGFEFFAWVPEDYLDSIRLPTKFAEVLRGQEPRELMVREAGGGPVYNVEVHLDDDGQIHLAQGWYQFARDHSLATGQYLQFTYGGDTGMLTVKVFDGTCCRRVYKIKDEVDSDED